MWTKLEFWIPEPHKPGVVSHTSIPNVDTGGSEIQNHPEVPTTRWSSA